ncbi:MAG: signal peptide peptidase SppA [Myxococcota bacterium]
MKSYLYWFFAAATLVACGTRSSSPAPDAAAAADESAADAPSQSMGQFDMFRSLLSSQLDQPGPYEEPRQSESFDDDEPHLAVLELAGPVAELPGFSLWSGSAQLTLSGLVNTLDRLAAEDSVRGALLRVGDLTMSVATAEEIRRALLRFKGSGGERVLLCHTEGVSNFTYYVLTACDSIALVPTGELAITGVASVAMHLKGLLDKLGIEADFLQIGAYKGLAEPLTRDRPSPEARATMDAILDRAYETLVTGIAEGRKLERETVVAAIDRALFHGEDARAAGLIDGVATFAQYRASELERLGISGWTAIDIGKSEVPDTGRMMRFLGMLPRSRPGHDRVALVYALGDIISGAGSGSLGAREEIAARTLSAALTTLAGDDSVKAVVLRIDSGGGSALASEQIWHAMSELLAKKPVVVSMAGVAASGGYYIACGATRIFALDNTLTGSIGVVGGKLATRDALDEIGVAVFPAARGRRALIYAGYDRWSADERTAIEGSMQRVYTTFVQRVADGRKKDVAAVETVAQGRVWTGAAARENGLVDRIGGLAEALAEARQLGGVADDAELEIYPPEPTVIDIINSFGDVSASSGLSARVDAVLATLGQVLGPIEVSATRTLLGQVLLLRDTPILTAAFLPVVVR